MNRSAWDGIVPGGRLRWPRCDGGVDVEAAPARTRRGAAEARVRRVTPGRRGRVLPAAAMLALVVIAPRVASAGAPEAAPSQAARTHVSMARSLEGRMKLLTAELQLTPDQQLRVRALLERQREQVRELWSDSSVPPAQRVGSTQAISDRTVAAIRGLLDATQREKYIQPRQREAAVGTEGADVQSWMSAESRQ